MSDKTKQHGPDIKGALSKIAAVIGTVFSYIRTFFIKMKVSKKARRKRSGSLRHEKVNAWSLFWFPFLFVYLELILRLCTKTSFFTHIFYPIAFGFALGMLFSAVLSLFSPKIIRIAGIALTVIISFFYGLMTVIYNSFGSFMTLKTVFASTKNVLQNYTGMLFKSILSNILVIILFIAPMVFYCVFGKKFFKPFRYKWPMAFSFVILSLFIFAVSTLFAATGSTRGKYNKKFNFTSAVQTFGLATGTRLNTAYAGRSVSFNVIDETETVTSPSETEGGSGENTDTVSPSETTAPVKEPYGKNVMNIDFNALASSTDNSEWKALDEYVQTLQGSSKNEYTGLFAGKNMIFITAEAFCREFIDPNLTPTLYRLIHNGIYCSDYYQPAWGGSTITGELSNLLGLIPCNGVDTIYETIDHNLYFTIGNQLQRKGYYNIAYHNGDYDYYDRQLTHENLGYGTWCAIGNGLEDIANGWPPDGLTFDTTMDTYIDKTPFSIYYITCSGHCIYDYDAALTDRYIDRVSQFFPDKMPVTQAYICYQMELENALTIMVNKLEEAGIADDTVIVLSSDHFPYGLQYEAYGNTQDYLSDLFGFKITENYERDRNALILWSGCLENENSDMAKEITAPVYSPDILPTISNLFGLEYDSRLMVGRDILSDADALVVWIDGSWKSELGFYDSFTDTFFPAGSAEIPDQDAYVEKTCNIAQNKINFSRSVISNDYYRHLFGDDNDTSSNDR